MKHIFVSIHVEPSTRAVPLAAAMLVSVLKEAFGNKLEAVIQNFYCSDQAESCAQQLLAYDADCIAFSTYTWNSGLCREIAARIRAVRPEIILYAGGPEVSAAPERFNADGLFDFLIPGEGELLIVDYVRMLLEGTTNTRQQGPAENYPFVPDLARLPSPYLDGTLDLNEAPGVLWELARGCPFSCHFCYESRGNHGVRQFPSERIQKELELFARSGVQEIFVLDPTFNYDRKRAKELLTLMINTAPDIQYFIEIRAEFLDRQTAALFSELRCSLQIGLQSALPGVLKNIGRTFNPELFQKKVLHLHNAGVIYGFDLIYGLPGDTLSGFLESLDFALGMVPNHIDIFPLAVLPGTQLAKSAPEFSLKYAQDPPYLVISAPTWSTEDLQAAARITDAVDLFYNMGKAVPWFPLVLSNLQLQASVFFQRLVSWLPGKNTEDIIGLQQDFLALLFNEQGKQGAALVAADLARWFGNIDEYELSGWHENDFHFDPEYLIEQIETGVEDFEALAE